MSVVTDPVRVAMACRDCIESWQWFVIYRDGQTLRECSGQGQHAAFAAIDLPRVERMALIPQRPGLPRIVVIMTDPSMRPVFFRRRQVELQTSTLEKRPRQTIHCLGWAKNLQDGTSVQSFTFIFENGSVVVSDDRNVV